MISKIYVFLLTLKEVKLINKKIVCRKCFNAFLIFYLFGWLVGYMAGI